MADNIKLEVKGMTCGGCESSVKKIISRHFDIDLEKVSASHEKNHVEIFESVANLDAVFALLDDAGFPAQKID